MIRHSREAGRNGLLYEVYDCSECGERYFEEAKCGIDIYSKDNIARVNFITAHRFCEKKKGKIKIEIYRNDTLPVRSALAYGERAAIMFNLNVQYELNESDRREAFKKAKEEIKKQFGNLIDLHFEKLLEELKEPVSKKDFLGEGKE
jgi:hypothetical protein